MQEGNLQTEPTQNAYSSFFLKEGGREEEGGKGSFYFAFESQIGLICS